MQLSLKALVLTLAACSALELKAETKHYLSTSDALSFGDGLLCLKRYRVDSCQTQVVFLRRLRANSHGMYWMHADRKKKVNCLKEIGLEKGMHGPRKKITLQP